MTEKSFTVGKLKKIIAESANEFKPVIGKNVESDNKKNNDKSYKDMEKATKEYNGSVKQPKKVNYVKQDFNKTTLDYNPVNEPNKEYKDRINAQAKGYTSKLEQDNKIEKAAEFDSNEEFLKAIKDSSNDVLKRKSDLAHSGLKSRMLQKPEYNTLAEGSKPLPKRLTFKYSKFVCESQVLSKVPDAYKVDGQVIHMADNYGNVYIVECTLNKKTNIVESEVISSSNKQMMNEQLDRIQNLFGYKSKNSRDVKSNVINENTEFKNILNTCNGKK